MSGPHDFFVRNGITRPRKACALTPSRPSHPASRVVTIAHTPLLPRRDAAHQHILLKNGSKILFAAGLDSGLSVESVCEFRFFEHKLFHSGSSVISPRPLDPAFSERTFAWRRELIAPGPRAAFPKAYATAGVLQIAADLLHRRISAALGQERK